MVIVLFLLIMAPVIAWMVFESKKERVEARSQFEDMKQRLESSPLDQDLHNQILSFIGDQRDAFSKHNALAQECYPLALGILENNPDSLAAKQFALEAGRTSHAAGRADKKPTIYDEQAIQNDIMIRCNNAAPQLTEV